MARAGFDYDVARRGDESLPTLQKVVSNRQEYGYGIASPVPGSSSRTDVAGMTAGMSAAERDVFLLALAGTAAEGDAVDSGNGGCQAFAEADVYSRIPFYQPAYSVIPGQFLEVLLSDTLFVAAQRAWSECVASFGYDALNSEDLQSSFQAEWMTLDQTNSVRVNEFFARELAAALADTRCYLIHVAEVKSTVETRILSDFIEQGKLPSTLLDAAS